MLRTSVSRLVNAGLRHCSRRQYSAAAAAIPDPITKPEIQHDQVGTFLIIHGILIDNS